MLPYSFIGAGTYTNPAVLATVKVPLSDIPDWFFVKDLTNSGFIVNPPGTNYIAANPIYAEWFSSMAPGSFLGLGQTAAAIMTPSLFASQGATGGFTFVDPSRPPTFAALAATSINNVTWVVAMANTGSIVVGDYVKVINPVGMLQASGLIAQVTAVVPNVSITLGYVASAVAAGLVFAAPATSASIIKFIPSLFYPRAKQTMFVTNGVQATVFFASQNDFTPGELLDFSTPVPFGMIQLNSLTGLSGGAARVLTVTNSATVSSVTLDLNSAGYTPFVYPASGVFTSGPSPAFTVPAGAGVVPFNGMATVPASPPGTNLAAAFDNKNQFLMTIGTAACGSPLATMQWMAFKSDFGNLSNA